MFEFGQKKQFEDVALVSILINLTMNQLIVDEGGMKTIVSCSVTIGETSGIT